MAFGFFTTKVLVSLNHKKRMILTCLGLMEPNCYLKGHQIKIKQHVKYEEKKH
jgi:hypothetical protein